jgi:hypothetical protein
MRGGHNLRQTKEQREEILSLYLDDPAAGTALAMSRGLSPAYAYRLAHERGALPHAPHMPKARRA